MYKKIITATILGILLISPLATSAQTLTPQQIVEILISAGLISPENAERAKTALSTKINPATNTAVTDGSFCYSFTRNLRMGDTGSDVTALAKALAKLGIVTEFEIAGTYGLSLHKGIIRFQEKYATEVLTPAGLITGTGVAGSFTRAKLNRLFLCNSISTAVTAPKTTWVTDSNETRTTNSATEPYYSGENSSATVRVTKTSVFGSREIIPGQTAQILGGFDVLISAGADSKFQLKKFKFSFTPAPACTGTTCIPQFTSLYLSDQNGKILAGPTSSVGNTITFENVYGIVPAGTLTLVIKGQSKANSTGVLTLSALPLQWSIHTYSGEPVSLAGNAEFVTGSSMYYKSSDTTVTPTTNTGATTPTDTTTNNTTVTNTSASLSVKATNRSDKTVTAGSTGVVFNQILLDATNSPESMDVDLITIPFVVTSGKPTDLNSCNIYENDRLVSDTSISPTVTSGSYTFSMTREPVTVSAGSSRTIVIKCNVASGATGKYSWQVSNGIKVQARHRIYGIVTPTYTYTTGPIVTATVPGTVSIALHSTSPVGGTARLGDRDANVTILNITAGNEPIALNQIGLKLSTNTNGALIESISGWNQGEKLGTANFDGSTATLYLSSPLVVPANTSRALIVKANIVSSASTLGIVKIGYDGVNSSKTKATGQSSGVTITPSSAADVFGYAITISTTASGASVADAISSFLNQFGN